MSIATLILGESGTGKSAAMRNLSPSETLLIQVVKKPLPFRSAEWQIFSKDTPSGNVFVTDQADKITQIMQKTQRKIIILDDFQYVMANEFMRRSDERGFDKFTDIGRHAWDIFDVATKLPDDVRVYILSHTQSDEQGNTKLKTIGKMLDEKITMEGLVTIVSRTKVIDNRYLFSTRNNGRDTVKTPMGLFEEEFIENDIAAVDAAICDYYGIKE